MLLEAIDHFLIKRGEFTDLLLQDILDVIAPEFSEIIETDETFGIEGRSARLDKSQKGGPEQFADRSGFGRQRMVTDLAVRPGVFRHEENGTQAIGRVEQIAQWLAVRMGRSDRWRRESCRRLDSILKRFTATLSSIVRRQINASTFA